MLFSKTEIALYLKCNKTKELVLILNSWGNSNKILKAKQHKQKQLPLKQNSSNKFWKELNMELKFSTQDLQ